MNEEEKKEAEAEAEEKEAEAESEEKDDTAELIAGIKAEYETKLQQQRAKFEDKLKERESVIKQLVSGNAPKEEPSKTPIADEINSRVARRNRF